MTGVGQLSLFGDASPPLGPFVRGPVDRAGMFRYVHVIRADDDPERSPRPRGGRADRAPHRTLDAISVEECTAMILALLADGQARTFNALSVELFDQTADITLDSPLDEALWSLVEGERMELTLEAPIHFRLVGP